MASGTLCYRSVGPVERHECTGLDWAAELTGAQTSGRYSELQSCRIVWYRYNTAAGPVVLARDSSNSGFGMWVGGCQGFRDDEIAHLYWKHTTTLLKIHRDRSEEVLRASEGRREGKRAAWHIIIMSGAWICETFCASYKFPFYLFTVTALEGIAVNKYSECALRTPATGNSFVQAGLESQKSAKPETGYQE